MCSLNLPFHLNECLSLAGFSFKILCVFTTPRITVPNQLISPVFPLITTKQANFLIYFFSASFNHIHVKGSEQKTCSYIQNYKLSFRLFQVLTTGHCLQHFVSLNKFWKLTISDNNDWFIINFIAHWLQAARSGDRIPAGERNLSLLQNIYNGSGTHTASHLLAPGRKSDEAWGWAVQSIYSQGYHTPPCILFQ